MGKVIAALILCFVAIGQCKNVQVDIYMESKCPDTIRLFKESVLTTYNQVKNISSFNFVPYGNAHQKKVDGVWTFQCQHGPAECVGNIMQVCVLSYVLDNQDQVKFMHCAMVSPAPEKSGEKNNQFKMRVEITSGSPTCKCKDYSCRCIGEIGKADLWSKVQKCRKGNLGLQLEHEMGLKTDRLSPKHTFIPWIVIDGQPLEYSKALNPESFTKAVQDAYKKSQ